MKLIITNYFRDYISHKWVHVYQGGNGQLYMATHRWAYLSRVPIQGDHAKDPDYYIEGRGAGIL